MRMRERRDECLIPEPMSDDSWLSWTDKEDNRRNNTNGESKELPTKSNKVARNRERREMAQVLNFDDEHSNKLNRKCAGTQTALSGTHDMQSLVEESNVQTLATADSLPKQERPSVIVPPSQGGQVKPLDLRQSSSDANTSQQGHRREILSGLCDPVIEEHFRRSLGKDYPECLVPSMAPSLSNAVSVTGSVDDHFAKALGDTWTQLNAQGPNNRSPSPPTSTSMVTI